MDGATYGNTGDVAIVISGILLRLNLYYNLASVPGEEFPISAGHAAFERSSLGPRGTQLLVMVKPFRHEFLALPTLQGRLAP
jgi:hypothetical protein